MELQQNNRITTTFPIKNPVKTIPLMLTTLSSGCACTANTPHPNDASFNNLARKAASAIKPAVYTKLYMQRCTSDCQTFSQEHLQVCCQLFRRGMVTSSVTEQFHNSARVYGCCPSSRAAR